MKRWLGFDFDHVVRTFKIHPLFKTMRCCCCLFLVWVRKSREKRTKSCNFEDWWLYPFEVPLSATASSASHLFIISYA